MSESDPGGSEPRIHEGGFSGIAKGEKRLVSSKKEEEGAKERVATNPKYLLASPHLSPVKYQSPTAYQLVASSGSASASS